MKRNLLSALAPRLAAVHRRTPPRNRFQVLSDLHLEVGQQYASFAVPPTEAQYLVLAGDIGRLIDYAPLLKFLQRLVPSYRRIFYVLGNHEFYGLSYAAGIDKARGLTNETSLQGRVTLLHRERWDAGVVNDSDAGSADQNLSVLGCTLWSSIPPDAREIVTTKVSDFKQIDGWNVCQHNQLHGEEVAWLRGQVEQMRTANNTEDKPRTILVVTHHAPSLEGTSAPKNAGNPWSSAFATELLLDGRSPPWNSLAAWVFGHTHYCNDLVVGGVRLVANQRGYVLRGVRLGGGSKDVSKGTGNNQKHEFDASKTIVV